MWCSLSSIIYVVQFPECAMCSCYGVQWCAVVTVCSMQLLKCRFAEITVCTVHCTAPLCISFYCIAHHNDISLLYKLFVWVAPSCSAVLFSAVVFSSVVFSAVVFSAAQLKSVQRQKKHCTTLNTNQLSITALKEAYEK